MWLKRYSNFLLEHPIITLGVVFAITFVPVIGMIGILIAAFITLQKSIVEGAILTVAASLPYVISFILAGNPQPDIPLAVWAAVSVAVISNILTWVFAVMLQRQANWSFILQVAALVGVLVISVLHLAYPAIADWWGEQLLAYYNHAKTVTSALKSSAMNGVAAVSGVAAEASANNADVQVEAINVTKQYATGIMTMAILFNALLQLLVARWWQAALFAPGSLRKELLNIRLSRLAGILFAVSMVLSYLDNRVVLDTVPVIYMLFGAAGLSLAHYMLGKMTAGSSTTWFWLALLYVALLIGAPTSILMISLLAVFDIGFDLRKRFRKI